MRPFLFVVLAAALATDVARADPANDAKDLFEQGRALRAAGKCADAAPLFEKAAAIFPSGLGSVRNAAECEAEIGHYATAHRIWLDLKRAVMLSKDEKYAGWQADAEAAAAQLEPKLARLTVRVAVEGQGETADPHVAVAINGEAIDTKLVGTSLYRDPGRYIVKVTSEGQDSATQTVELAAGDAKDLRFAVKAPIVVEPPPGDGTTHTPPGRIVGFVGLGVGAAALVGAGISLGIRQAALSDLNTLCPKYESQPCPSSVQSTVSRGTTASTLVNVLGIAGGVLVVGGILLVVLSPSRHTEAKASAYVPELSVGLGSFSARWSFQ